MERKPGGSLQTLGCCAPTLTSIQSYILWLFGFSFSSLSICLHSSSEVSSLRLGTSELSPIVYSNFWGSRQRELLKAAQGSTTLTLPKVHPRPTSAPRCHQAPTCSVTNLLTSWSSGRNSFQLRPPSRHSFPAVFWPCGTDSRHQHAMPSHLQGERYCGLAMPAP